MLALNTILQNDLSQGKEIRNTVGLLVKVDKLVHMVSIGRFGLSRCEGHRSAKCHTPYRTTVCETVNFQSNQ